MDKVSYLPVLCTRTPGARVGNDDNVPYKVDMAS